MTLKYLASATEGRNCPHRHGAGCGWNGALGEKIIFDHVVLEMLQQDVSYTSVFGVCIRGQS